MAAERSNQSTAATRGRAKKKADTKAKTKTKTKTKAKAETARATEQGRKDVQKSEARQAETVNDANEAKAHETNEANEHDELQRTAASARHDEQNAEREENDTPEAALAVLQASAMKNVTMEEQEPALASEASGLLGGLEAELLTSAHEARQLEAPTDDKLGSLDKTMEALAASSEEQSKVNVESPKATLPEANPFHDKPLASDEIDIEGLLAEQNKDNGDAAVDDLAFGSFVERIENSQSLSVNLNKFNWNRNDGADLTMVAPKIELHSEDMSQNEMRQAAVTKAVNHLTLRHAIRDARTVAHIPNLGKVSIHATNILGELNIDVTAGAEAAAIIQSASAQLEQHLQNQSLELANLDIHEDNETGQGFAFMEDQDQQNETDSDKGTGNMRHRNGAADKKPNSHQEPAGIVL